MPPGTSESLLRQEYRRPHFVTGKLAAPSLRRTLESMAAAGGFKWTLEVLPITVAALMTPAWIARHIHVPADATVVILPGYCGGDLTPLKATVHVPVECGPRDLHGLPEFFGQRPHREGFGAFDIEIIAEVNHAPRQPLDATVAMAKRYVADGADIVDIGCDPADTWPGLGDCVSRLRDLGLRVSVDSMNVAEISAAVAAGAELVLSVNSQNLASAADWGCEVVVIPDDPKTLAGLDRSIEFLVKGNISFRIDPILEPIGFGFADSLGRYLEIRRRYPDARMMMGIGNLTELTECDSAAINTLLLGFCQEIAVQSVLTTEVISWAATSVRECDVARRLAYYAVSQATLPKHLNAGLVMLRSLRRYDHGEAYLTQLADEVRDANYRLFAESGQIHAVSKQTYCHDADPFRLFEQLTRKGPAAIDPAHAFYLGYEMCKASIALTLEKNYEQDEALDWGLLTVEEASHRLMRGRTHPKA